MAFSKLITGVIFSCVFFGLAGTATAGTDEDAVRAVIAKNIHGWATYNADELVSTYSSDVIWQNPFGVRLQGQAQLKAFLIRLFARPGFRSGKDVSAPVVQAVRMFGHDAAVVWSEETSSGQIENGKPLGERRSHYLQVLRRTPQGWRVTDEMVMDEREIPSR